MHDIYNKILTDPLYSLAFTFISAGVYLIGLWFFKVIWSMMKSSAKSYAEIRLELKDITRKKIRLFSNDDTLLIVEGIKILINIVVGIGFLILLHTSLSTELILTEDNIDIKYKVMFYISFFLNGIILGIAVKKFLTACKACDIRLERALKNLDEKNT